MAAKLGREVIGLLSERSMFVRETKVRLGVERFLKVVIGESHMYNPKSPWELMIKVVSLFFYRYSYSSRSSSIRSTCKFYILLSEKYFKLLFERRRMARLGNL